MATIGVVGRHRPARLPRTVAHGHRTDGDVVRRAWVAPLLALLAIGLLPVLGRSLVWFGTTASEAPVSETTAAAPSSTRSASPGPTPSTGPNVAGVVPPTIASPSSSPPAAPASATKRSTPPSATPAPVAVVPPAVVVAPSGPDSDPATVQQPDDTTSQDSTRTGDSGPVDITPANPDPVDQIPTDPDPLASGG